MGNTISVDAHCHSRRSDGIHTEAQVVEDIRRNTRNFSGDIVAVLTNHNEATTRISSEGIHTCSGVEVTTINEKGFMAHLLLYARNFSSQVDQTLSGVRQNQMYNIMKNIETLQNHGFDVNNEDFLKFFSSRGYNTENINRFQLARYVIANKNNRRHANAVLKDYNIENNVDGYVIFLRQFLYENGNCNEFGYCSERKINGIHPSELAEIAIQEDGIISFAHPQVTCRQGGITAFRKIFKRYYDLYNVRAIEIPAVASVEWVEAIIKLAKEYNCMVTFGTDSHGYPADNTHGNIMHINPYAPKSLVHTNSHLFKDEFCEDSLLQKAA